MIAGLAVGLSGAGTASAATTTFSFIGNSPCGASCPVNVQAAFTIVGGNLQIVLTNNSNTDFDQQVLTGLYFTGTHVATSMTQVGQTAIVPSGTTASQLYALNNDATGALTALSGSLGWGTSTGSALDLAGYVTLTNLEAPGIAQGAQGIIGYNTAGATNNLSNHDPYVFGSATFTLTGTGITDTASITDVKFNFGTALGGTNIVSLVATPEPGSIALCIGGLGLLAAGVRRRRG